MVSFEDDTSGSGIEGLIRSTELSWSGSPEAALKKYSVGDLVKAKILMVATNKNKIDLGVKQIERDPFLDLLKRVEVGDRVAVTVSKVLEDMGVLVDVFEGSESFNVLVKQEHLPENKKFFPGDRVEAEVLTVGSYSLVLSLK